MRNAHNITRSEKGDTKLPFLPDFKLSLLTSI